MEIEQIVRNIEAVEESSSETVSSTLAHEWLTELANQKDIADRFSAHASAIWNAVFPDDIDGWEYGEQLERCVVAKIADLETRIAALECGKFTPYITESNAGQFYVWVRSSAHEVWSTRELAEARIAVLEANA